MEYFVISAKFVPLKYYTLSSQLRRLTSFSVGLFGSANSVTRSYPVMRKSCIDHFRITAIWPGDRIRRPEHPTENEVRRRRCDESV